MVLLSLERREEALEAARNAVDVMKDAPYGTSREYVRVQQEYLYARQQVVRVLRQMGRDREAAAIKEESETELIEMIRQSQSKEVRDDLQSITIHFCRTWNSAGPTTEARSIDRVLLRNRILEEVTDRHMARCGGRRNARARRTPTIPQLTKA